MLKGIDRAISAELLMVLMSIGHGDDLLICDVNHPAATIARDTTYGRLVSMTGCDLPRAAEAILSLLPLDTFRWSTTPSASCRCTSACKASSTGSRVGRWASRPLNVSISTPPPGAPLRSSEPRIPDHMAALSCARVSFETGAGWREGSVR
jgi:hypothetical protein